MCEENPDAPLNKDILWVLPIALRVPGTLALIIFTVTRVLRNLIDILDGAIHHFDLVGHFGAWGETTGFVFLFALD